MPSLLEIYCLAGFPAGARCLWRVSLTGRWLGALVKDVPLAGATESRRQGLAVEQLVQRSQTAPLPDESTGIGRTCVPQSGAAIVAGPAEIPTTHSR